MDSSKSSPKFPSVLRKSLAFGSPEVRTSSSCSEQVAEGKLLKCIAKGIGLALVFLAVGFAPIRTVRAGAVAALVAEVLEEKEKESNSKGHEYSNCTRRLLETVSFLLRSVEKARRGNGGAEQVEAALKAVKAKKEELQREIMDGLYAELRELKGDKEMLERRSEEIVAEAAKAKARNAAEKVDEYEESLSRLEKEYKWVWERVGEIEDRILRRETLALSFGVRELCFIERECEQLVQGFTREMRRKGFDRYERLDSFGLCKNNEFWFLLFFFICKHLAS